MAQSNKHWWIHLTSTMALRRRLREKDATLTHNDLLHGLFMLSKHFFVIQKNVPRKMDKDYAITTEKQIMPFTEYSTPLYRNIGLDLYHRAYYAGDKANPRETSVVERTFVTNSSSHVREIFLHRNGDIKVGPILYQVQASAIIQCFEYCIVYRGKDRYYYVLDFESLQQLDIPNATQVRSLQCAYGINPPYHYLVVQHILYDNGDLHEAEIEYFVHWKTPARQHKLVRRNIKNIIWVGYDYWIITIDGELHYITQGKIRYSYLDTIVNAMTMYQGMFGRILCFLTATGDIYCVDTMGKNMYHRLLYKSNASFRAMKLFNTSEREMVIRLLR